MSNQNKGEAYGDVICFRDTMSSLELEYKRILIKGFLNNCPAGKPLDDCPLEKIRALSSKERIRAINMMNADVVEFVYTKHEECLHERL